MPEAALVLMLGTLFHSHISLNNLHHHTSYATYGIMICHRVLLKLFPQQCVTTEWFTQTLQTHQALESPGGFSHQKQPSLQLSSSSPEDGGFGDCAFVLKIKFYIMKDNNYEKCNIGNIKTWDMKANILKDKIYEWWKLTPWDMKVNIMKDKNYES